MYNHPLQAAVIHIPLPTSSCYILFGNSILFKQLYLLDLCQLHPLQTAVLLRPLPTSSCLTLWTSILFRLLYPLYHHPLQAAVLLRPLQAALLLGPSSFLNCFAFLTSILFKLLYFLDLHPPLTAWLFYSKLWSDPPPPHILCLLPSTIFLCLFPPCYSIS